MAESKEQMWARGRDEPVEIDQRALIDKVLARYSGEFTVFRELLQNSDDAESQAVQIHFETERHDMNVDATTPDAELRCFKPDLTKSVHQWRFMNNGKVFNEEDWNRLRKIAAGSPDEDKIGAFGVGFYSLFSVTEEPFVTSGGEWMGFYWKDNKDRLFVRRGDLQQDQVKNDWTTFHMPLRNPGPVPPMFDLCRFLASSITFMLHLKEVAVYLDGQQLSKFTKFADPPIPLVIPAGFECYSPKKIMRIKGLQSTTVNIKAQIMGWIYGSGGGSTASLSSTTVPQSGGVTASPRRASTPPNVRTALGSHPSSNVQQQASSKSIGPLETSESKITLSILSASVDVTLEQKLGAELHRSMKKSPPSTLRYDLVYMGKEGYDASVKEEENHGHHTRSIFQGLRADLEGAGGSHVSIGHRTSQTTGLGGHMAARFIPTVERESIDFVDRHVAIWNKELLYVGGFLARSTYEFQMEEIAKEWAGALKITNRLDAKTQGRLLAKSLHVLKFFSFHPSTPSPQVSGIMEHAFFTCRRNCPLQFISTIGIRDARTVRMPMEKLEFLKGLCVVPQQIITNLRDKTIKSFRRHGFLKDIQLSDIKLALENQPLNEGDAIAWLKWWQEKAVEGQKVHSQYKELLGFASLALTLQGATGAKVIPMLRITSFVHTQASGGTAYIPPDSPLPETVLPYGIARELAPDFLRATCGLKELSIVDWLRYVVTELPQEHPSYDMTTVSRWAERVLMVLSKAWPLLDSSKGSIVEMLKGCTCVPTSDGLKVPKDSYFASADIFHDLPVVEFKTSVLHGRDLDRFLVDLGVQASLPIDCVFDRMIATDKWSAPEIVLYFLNTRSYVSRDERHRLRQLRAFMAESDSSNTRHLASELHHPSDSLRALGLLIVRWGPPHTWNNHSDSAKFMHGIGLRSYPSLRTLISLCASNDDTLRTQAFKYLLDNMATYCSYSGHQDSTKKGVYRPEKFHNVAFVPALKNGRECLASPTQVYCDPEWSRLGFATIAPSLSLEFAVKLQLPLRPQTGELLALLENSHFSCEEAREWFSVLGGQDFSPAEFDTLSRTAFVPIRSGPSVRYCSPALCFLGDPPSPLHSKLFDFVDFGPLGNTFLTACGSKQKPSVEQIVQSLLKSPKDFYLAAGSQERNEQLLTLFLLALSNIATELKSLSSDTIMAMKRTPILIGIRRSPLQTKQNEKDEKDMGNGCQKWEFPLHAHEIVVVDDLRAYQVFQEDLFSAPPQDDLEELYLQLGSRKLSTTIDEQHHLGLELHGHGLSYTRSLVLNRLKLLLHSPEHAHDAQMRQRFDWLNAPENFQVRVFDNLEVTMLCTHPCVQRRYTFNESAGIFQCGPDDPLQLRIAHNLTEDFYAVAISLCRYLFCPPRMKHALLLMGLLSSDDDSLKHLGYDPTRITKQESNQADFLPLHRPAHNPISQFTVVSAQQLPHARSSQFLPLVSHTSQSPREPNTFLIPFPITCGSGAGPTGTDTPVRQELLSESIQRSVLECKPYPGVDRVLKSSAHLQQFEANAEIGCHEISGGAGVMRPYAIMDGVGVHISPGIALSNLVTKHSLIRRFISLIKPLRQLYELHVQSIHIFYNTAEHIVVWNAPGGIYLNLRTYEARHDEQVRRNNLKPAYISWYFALARGIAHSLVDLPSVEHEYYFSAISQMYLPKLRGLLSSPQH